VTRLQQSALGWSLLAAVGLWLESLPLAPATRVVVGGIVLVAPGASWVSAATRGLDRSWPERLALSALLSITSVILADLVLNRASVDLTRTSESLALTVVAVAGGLVSVLHPSGAAAASEVQRTGISRRWHLPQRTTLLGSMLFAGLCAAAIAVSMVNTRGGG
jgi:hypothetical protein